MIYRNALLAEAIIDIRVALPRVVEEGDFLRFHDVVSNDFPHIQPVTQFQLELPTSVADNAGEPRHRATQVGVRLANASNDRVAQVLLNGLVLSHLPPYSCWEEFTSTYRKIWDSYVEFFHPEGITRVALRYVNRIPINNGEKVDQYVNLNPIAPGEISDEVIGFFSQVVVPIKSKGPEYRMIMNFGIEPQQPTGASAIVLDFDVFREGMSKPLGDPWSTLHELREIKKRSFEASITDHVREMMR